MSKKGTLCITIAANIADTAILDFDGYFPDSVVGFDGGARENDKLSFAASSELLSRSGKPRWSCGQNQATFPIGNMMRIASPADIGASVRDARRAAGLRQHDLAGLSGAGTRFLVELERGKPTIRLDKALAVLTTLGLTLELGSMPE